MFGLTNRKVNVKTKKTWKKATEKNTRQVWGCENKVCIECVDKVEEMFYPCPIVQDNSMPNCPECGYPMKYLRTEINI